MTGFNENILLTDKYITSSCTISNGVAHKGEQILLTTQATSINDLLISLYQALKLNYPRFYKMDNLSKLGWLAAEILLKDTSLKENYGPEEIGMVFANKNSSLDSDLKFHHTKRGVRSPSVFVYTLPNIVIGEVCICNNFKGEHSFFVQDKFDAGFIYNQVNYLLEQDILEACLCGWVDVLGEEYKAVLFLVEKKGTEQDILFSAANMDKIFNTVNQQLSN